MAAPISFSRWFAPLDFARLPVLEERRVPWIEPGHKLHGCPALREFPGTPDERTPQVFPGQRPPPMRTRHPVSGLRDEQFPLAVQPATRQQSYSLVRPQAPERCSRRDDLNTVPRSPSRHVSNVVSDDPFTPSGNCCLQHQFIVSIGDARTNPKPDGRPFSHVTKVVQQLFYFACRQVQRGQRLYAGSLVLQHQGCREANGETVGPDEIEQRKRRTER